MSEYVQPEEAARLLAGATPGPCAIVAARRGAAGFTVTEDERQALRILREYADLRWWQVRRRRLWLREATRKATVFGRSAAP